MASISLLAAIFTVIIGVLLYRSRQNSDSEVKFFSLIKKGALICGVGIFLFLILLIIPIKKPISLLIPFPETKTETKEELPYEIGGYFIGLKGSPLVERKLNFIEQYRSQGKNISDKDLQKFLIEENRKISEEQEAAKKEILSLAPQAKIEKTYSYSTNAIYVSNLTDTQAEELLKQGYKISRNYKLEFQVNNLPNFDLTGVNTPLYKINANPVHNMQIGNKYIKGSGVKIAIIDGGFDYKHSDFGCISIGLPTSCRVTDGWDYWDADPDPLDAYGKDGNSGHATHVASIAAGRYGIAPEATIYNYRIYGLESVLISAIERASDPNSDFNYSDKADIINMSLGGSELPADSELALAVNNATADGILTVASAGNLPQGILSPIDNKRVVCAPGAAISALAVGAIDNTDYLAHWLGQTNTWSTGGPTAWSDPYNGIIYTLIKPDVVAPGVNVCAARSSNFGYDGYDWNNGDCYDSQHTTLSGTSMSSPVVAGAAALIKQAHTNWTPAEIKSALRMTALTTVGDLSTRTIYDRGFGRINVLSAVNITGRPPVARLDSARYLRSSGTTFIVTGQASDSDTDNANKFKEYRVYYGQGRNPSAFILLKTFTIAVNNGTLFTVDTINTCLKGFEYLFRIEVEDYAGNISKDYMLIKVP